MVESKAALWTGRVLTGFVVAFLLFDGIIKLTSMPVVAETLASLGYPAKHAVMIGIVELACVVLFAIPRTSVLGAVLLTALLGGGIATHIRVDSPLFSHTLFGVYLGIITWAGLYLRDPRVRALLPLRS